MPTLELRSVSKFYGRVPAVRDISFTLRPGEVCGYLGANGSGKSTTVRILAGLTPQTSGEILYDGQPIARRLRDYRAQLGYSPEEPHLYGHLSAAEYLELVGGLRRIPETALRRRIQAALETFGLTGSRDAPMRSYSKGMKQKVLLSAAILHDPQILILDEPLSGLDVGAVDLVRHLFREYAARDRLVLHSSHLLDVVEHVCDRVIVLHQGRVAADDSVANLRALSRSASLHAAFAQLTSQPDYARCAVELVEAMAD